MNRAAGIAISSVLALGSARAMDCDGMLVYDHTDTQNYRICTTDPSGTDCTWGIYYIDVYRCESFPPPPGGGGSGNGGDPQPAPNPMDQNSDHIMDCWNNLVTTTNPSANVLSPGQKLGTDYGGTGTRPDHTGIDVDCNRGDPVLSSVLGVVRLSEFQTVAGQVVKIESFDGRFIAYAHLLKSTVHNLDIVSPGTQIGMCNASGSGGEAGDHLHYEIQCASNCFMDPEAVHPCASGG